MHNAFHTVAVGLALWAGLFTHQSGYAAERLLVFAAASTREAVLAVTEQASEELDIPIAVSFAGSATLARQIEQGAPAHLFLSANRQWMDYLQGAAAIEPDTRHDLVRNRLVLIAPRRLPSPKLLPVSTLALTTALGDGRFAIADPAVVPAGMYGKQALEALGLWSSVAGRLAPTAHVRATLALVERGAVPLGLVYATDAQASAEVSVVGQIPMESHEPIVYSLALTKAGAAEPKAHSLLRAFLSPAGRTRFIRHGFEPIAP